MRGRIAVEKVLENLRVREYSPKTIYDYKRDLCRFEQFYETLHNMPWDIDNTTVEDVANYMSVLKDEGKGAHLRNRIYYALRTFYKVLCQFGSCKNNPMLQLSPAKTPRTDKVILSKTEANQYTYISSRVSFMFKVGTTW